MKKKSVAELLCPIVGQQNILKTIREYFHSDMMHSLLQPGNNQLFISKGS